MGRLDWNFWLRMGGYYSVAELLAFLADWTWWLVERAVRIVMVFLEGHRAAAPLPQFGEQVAFESLQLPGRSRYQRRSYASLMPAAVMGKSTVSCELTLA
jgi:hypothetical protein